MLVLAGILVLILVCALALMILYNALVRGKNMADEAWSGISVQLTRRHHLIPSLVNTVKGYVTHERETLEAITNARAQAMAAPREDVNAVMKAENGLMRAMRSLFAVSENYPALQASTNFLQLQEQLSSLEDEIQMARRYYNATAREQNNRVLQFPGNLVANSFHFGKLDYFEQDDASEHAVPEVKF